MSVILKLWASDSPGVLDRITGKVRRRGWNIVALTTGETNGKISQITLSLQGKSIDVERLGEDLFQMDSIEKWQECKTNVHMVREMLLFYVSASESDILSMPDVRVVGQQDCYTVAEFTGSSAAVEDMLKILNKRNIICTRSGAVALCQMQEEQENGN